MANMSQKTTAAFCVHALRLSAPNILFAGAEFASLTVSLVASSWRSSITRFLSPLPPDSSLVARLLAIVRRQNSVLRLYHHEHMYPLCSSAQKQYTATQLRQRYDRAMTFLCV